MIFYDNDAWISTLFTLVGTVWPAIKKPMVVLAFYMSSAYAASVHFDTSFGHNGPTTSVVGGTLSFLLIFRANQAYIRYWDGRTSVSMFFTNLRDFLMLALMYVPGAKDREAQAPSLTKKLLQRFPELSELAVYVRVDLVRLCVAYAVLLKMHTRIAYDGYCFGKISGETKWLVDWDRLRLMQLLKEDEFYAIDRCIGIVDDDMRSGGTLDELLDQFRGRSHGPPKSWPEECEVLMEPACRPHNVCMFYLREVLFNNVNDAINSCPWGIKERFVPQLSKLLISAQFHFEFVDQIINTPLPLPYACLCKSLLVIFLASLPSMLTDVTVGVFGSLFLPMMVALALLGIDATATELENPFGDDANDLDVMEFVAGLEHEAVHLLRMCGDFQGKAAFGYRTMPEFVARSSCKPLSLQLVVEEFAAQEDVGDMKAGDSFHESEEGLLSGSRGGSDRSSQLSFREDDL